MNRRLLSPWMSHTVLLVLVVILISSTSVAAGGLAKIKVCIDPGHGGSDPGAVHGDLWESVINLDVAYGLKALLEADGAEVVLTRYDDSYLTNRDRYTFCNSQQPTILVSVHTNGSTDPEMDGTAVLYFHSDDQILAQAIHDVMYPYLQIADPVPDTQFTDFGVYRYASGVLLKSDMPAALVEPVFMSHPAEAALLQEPIYEDVFTGSLNPGCAEYNCRRGRIAEAIHQGIRAYFQGDPPPPTPDPDPSLHVAAVDMRYQSRGPFYRVFTEVAIQDANGNPVPDVMVAVNTVQPDASIVRSSGLTGDDGWVTFHLRSDLAGEYVSTVTSVGKDGWLYDADSNVETMVILQVP